MSDILRNARILVAGGASGIGLSTAHAFAKAGARVVIAGRDDARLHQAAANVGHGAEARAFDLLEEASISELFDGDSAFEHVVVTASSTKTGSVRSTSLEDAYASMNSKFFGAYRVGRAARIAPGGSLTFVSGLLDRRPSGTAVLQGAINAAIEGLVRGLALELAPVRVNAVCPGIIDTSLYDAMDKDARATMLAAKAAALPVRRVGSPEDVADAMLFLARNGFVTGSTLLIDGGGSLA